MYDLLKYLSTGAIVGLSDLTVSHPLWSLQVFHQDGLKTSSILTMVKNNPFIIYKGVVQNAVTSVPLSAIRISIHSHMHNNLVNYQDDVNKYNIAFLTGAITAPIVTPIELMRTIKLKSAQMATENSVHFNSFSSTLKYCVNKAGFKSIFYGTSLVALRDGIYTTAFFTGPAFFKTYLDDQIGDNLISTSGAFVLSSILASFINHPIDTVKTVQHTSQAEHLFFQSHSFKIFDAYCKILKTDGISGFYYGYFPRSLRLVVSFIIQSKALDCMQKLWLEYNEQRENHDNAIDQVTEPTYADLSGNIRTEEPEE